MPKGFLRASVSICALGGLCASAPAFAREAAPEPDRQLEEITVVARRVTENMQSVPVAITAYSGEALLQQGVKNLPDAAMLTPGLKFNPSQTSQAATIIQMRGQVQGDTLSTLDPSVGTYVDGVYWARAYGLTASLVDINSFQALKGPQGTLFGRNTPGGAIVVNTNNPSFSEGLSGSISGTYGRFNQQSLTAILNVPLVQDKIAARIVYSGNRRDGYVLERNSGQIIQNWNDYTVRGKLLLQPTEDFNLLLSADIFHMDVLQDSGRLGIFVPGGTSSFEAGLESLGAAACTANRPACLAAGDVILANEAALNKNPYVTSLTVVPHMTITNKTYSATATLNTSFGAIKVIGAYRNINYRGVDTENDGSKVRILDGSGQTSPQNITQWTGEVTATGKALGGSLDFATGVFFFHEYGMDDTPSSTFTEVAKLSTGGRRAITSFFGNIDAKSVGIYGQGTYRLTDKLSLTAGLRWSHDKRSLASSGGTTLVNPNGPNTFICAFPATGCPFTRGTSYSGWAYTVSLDYKINDDVMVYIKNSRGFRSGGLVLRGVAAVPASLNPFGPETIMSYEAGLKSEFFDRRLRVNLAGYFTHGTGVQRNTTVVVGTQTSTTTSNAGAVDVFGGELEFSALLPAGFRLDGTAAYTHPRYVSFIDFNGRDRRAEPFPFVPRWTATLSPQWQGDASFGKVNLRADFNYQSKQSHQATGFVADANGVLRDVASGVAFSATDVANFVRSNTDIAHVVVNARASVTLLDDKLELAVWGKNLTDLRDWVNGLTITSLGSTRVMLREPRTYGMTATVKF